MFFAKQLISRFVVTAFPEQRLSYLSKKILVNNAQYCAVLRPRANNLVGLVRFSHVAASPDTASRILSDLMYPPPPCPVDALDSLETVVGQLVHHEPAEVVVAEKTGQFIGLITPESFARGLLTSRPSLELALSKLSMRSRWHPSPPLRESLLNAI